MQSEHSNLCARAPNMIVVRPFKVVQFDHCTRLPRIKYGARTTSFFGDCHIAILSPLAGESYSEGEIHPHPDPPPSRARVSYEIMLKTMAI